MRLTAHAIERYRERVENIPAEQVMAKLLTQNTLAAIEFGARVIRLGCGAQLVIEKGAIVTVLGADQRPKRYGEAKRRHGKTTKQSLGARRAFLGDAE